MSEKKRTWLTVREAREILGVSDQTVRRLIDRGRLAWRNLGINKTEVLAEDVAALMRPRKGVS